MQNNNKKLELRMLAVILLALLSISIAGHVFSEDGASADSAVADSAPAEAPAPAPAQTQAAAEETASSGESIDVSSQITDAGPPAEMESETEEYSAEAETQTTVDTNLEDSAGAEYDAEVSEGATAEEPAAETTVTEEETGTPEIPPAEENTEEQYTAEVSEDTTASETTDESEDEAEYSVEVDDTVSIDEIIDDYNINIDETFDFEELELPYSIEIEENATVTLSDKTAEDSVFADAIAMTNKAWLGLEMDNTPEEARDDKVALFKAILDYQQAKNTPAQVLPVINETSATEVTEEVTQPNVTENITEPVEITEIVENAAQETEDIEINETVAEINIAENITEINVTEANISEQLNISITNASALYNWTRVIKNRYAGKEEFVFIKLEMPAELKDVAKEIDSKEALIADRGILNLLTQDRARLKQLKKALSETTKDEYMTAEFAPDSSIIKRIKFNSLKLDNDSISIGISDLSIEDSVQSYAIDPTLQNFTSAEITVTAIGSELYKCKEWNFTEQSCYGTWTKVMDLTAGQEYTLTLTPEDPAFKEYNYSTYAAVQQPGQKAYASANAGAKPPAAGPTVLNEAEFTTAQYNQLNRSDDSRVTTTSAVAQFKAHRFLFNISQEKRIITRINVSWEGYVSGGAPVASRQVDLYAWNFTRAAWTPSLASHTSNGADAWLNRSLSDIYNFINSTNAFIFIVESPSNTRTLYSDYVLIKIEYDVPPVITPNTPANNAYYDSAPPTNISFNCSVTDDINLTNVSLYITNRFNQSFNFNQSSAIKGISNSSAWSLVLETGNYTWGCEAYDSVNNSNYSVNRTLRLNWTFPLVQNVILNSTSGDNYTTDNLTCNYNLDTSSVTSAISWTINSTNLMLLYMPFEGNETNALKDYSGFNFNAFNNNSALWNYSMGYDGFGGMHFNGSNKLMIDASDILEPSNTFTVSLWLRRNGTQMDWAKVLWYGINDVDPWGPYGIDFIGASDTEIEFHVGNGALNARPSSGSILNDLTWYHIVGTYNGSFANIYIDGELKNSIALAGPVGQYDNANGLAIGGKWQDGQYFNGTIDDVRIYNRTLTTAEINALYQDKKDIIVSSELKPDEEWKCHVTPFSKYWAGYTVASNKLLTINHTPPSVTLDKPNDNYINSTGKFVNITFNASVKDYLGLQNCSLWTNITGAWQINQTNNVSGTLNTTSFNLTNLYNISFGWNIRCYAEDEDYGEGTPRSVKLDWEFYQDLAPNVSLISPIDNYVVYGTTANITFNATVADDLKTTNCSIWINNTGTWKLNSTQLINGTNNITYFRLYNLSGTIAVWNINCFDNSSKNAWASENRTIYFSGAILPPLVFNVTLNASSKDNLTYDNLTCSYVLNNVSNASAIAWYRNNTPLMKVYLPMEGGFSNAIKDYSGSGNHFTNMTKMLWNYTGGYNRTGGFRFNGTQQSYLVDDDGENYVNGLTEFTVSMWLKSETIGQNRGFVAGRDPDAQDRYFSFTYVAAGPASGCTNCIRAVITTPTQNNVTIESSSNKQTTGWQLFTLRWKNGGTLELFLNGTKDTGAYTNVAGVGTVTGLQKVLLGLSAYAGANEGWQGMIDDFRLYNKYLSDEQIKTIYDNRSYLIVDTETEETETWRCEVTPFSSTEAGTTEQSNSLYIKPISNIIITNLSLNFGDTIADSITDIINSLNIQNLGAAAPTSGLNATFATNLSTGFGLISATDIINGSNFALNNTYLSSRNISTEIISNNSLIPGLNKNISARLIVPPGQYAGNYSGTVILRWNS